MSRPLNALSIALLLSTPMAFGAEAEAPEMINKITCSAGTDSRDLEIVAKDSGHVVSYTKGGKTTEVGTCSMTKTKCQEVFDRIKANLEKAGYVCKN